MVTQCCAPAIAVLAAGCSTSSPSSPPPGMDASADAGPPPVCLSDLPAACPTPMPSYKTDVQPILATYCVTCHSPSGCCGYNEVTYAEVSAQASSILDQVYDCDMPPIGSPMLTTQERLTLLGWLVCKAPDN
jgi:hypothetical protein